MPANSPPHLTGNPFSLLFRKPPATAGTTATDLPAGRWRVVLRGADGRGRQFRVERTEVIEDGVVRHRAGTETIDFARLARAVIKVARAPDGTSFSLLFRNGPSEAGSTKTDLPPGRYRLQLRGAGAGGKPFTAERTETIRNGIVRHRGGVDTIDFAVLAAR